MGLFGAFNNAVGGLQAQSYAMENISGNIANSATTAFKRVDTSFQDLIPDMPVTKQVAGGVSASARATNTLQGDLQSASIGTFMAVNGQGYFVVQKPTQTTSTGPVFDNADLYTRRGDFQTNKDGYLVNGSGYYLMGIPLDAKTGQSSGTNPQLLQFKNASLPAVATTEIDYNLNLPKVPQTAAFDKQVPGSELLDPASFAANPLVGATGAASIVGKGAKIKPDAAAAITGSQPLSAATINAGTLTINGTAVAITAGMTPADVVSAINTAAPPGLLPATLDSSGKLQLTSSNLITSIDIASSSPALASELGVAVGTTEATNLLSQGFASGPTLAFAVGSNPPLTITFGTNTGEVSSLAELQTALAPLAGGTATVDPDGNLTVVATSLSDSIEVTGTADATKLGMKSTHGVPSNQQVLGYDAATFLDQSISGGSITCYDQAGSPVNVQLRWAKVDNASLGSGHIDTWNLFYQTDPSAAQANPAWQNVGVNYSFDASGQMSPPVTETTLNNVTVNGIALGNVKLEFGAGAFTQFSDTNGTAKINSLTQDGYQAGSLDSIAVGDNGRVTGTFSNGRKVDLAEISLVNFKGANELKRLDGGAFAATQESGPSSLSTSGQIVASSLEGSNVDIADEFTKLIITQQAYSANTRVITASDEMVKGTVDLIR